MGISVRARTSPMMANSAESPALLRTSSIRKQPEWRPDASSSSCNGCRKDFSLLIRRRHHCRACGELVCADCSPYLDHLPELGYDGPVRVCRDCKTSTEYSSSEASGSENEGQEMDEHILDAAVEVIASHSTHKHSKLSYEYFVRSEAVSWLVDAGLCKSRSGGASVFSRLVEEGYVSVKPWSGSRRSTFYILSEVACAESRSSHYDSAMHSETSKCSNCHQRYLAKLTRTPGFCSIDCKTNAQISHSDSARIRRYYNN
jgi:hypothetical protein